MVLQTTNRNESTNKSIYPVVIFNTKVEGYHTIKEGDNKYYKIS